MEQYGLPFEVISQEINELSLKNEIPRETCLRLAEEKARAAAPRVNGHSAWIIGADQVMDLDGEAVSKPGNFETAFDQLKRAQGRTLMNYAALALFDTETGVMRSDAVVTEVTYRPLTDAEITRYLHRDQPYDCAGAIKVETSGIALLSRIRSDDPTALIGLPMIRLTDFLRDAGYPF